MSDNTELKKMIFGSELSFDEKEELAWLFADASEEEIDAAKTLFTEDPIWISRLSDNYRKKKLAFLTDDVELWKQILAEEKVYAAA
ncbi:hypothetical protein L0Y69_03300 [bacterium]|nr:hypothetical protein [bacterium]